MPYTAAQHRLFEAIAHGAKARTRTSLTKGKAAELASEGVKPSPDFHSRLAAAIKRPRRRS